MNRVNPTLGYRWFTPTTILVGFGLATMSAGCTPQDALPEIAVAMAEDAKVRRSVDLHGYAVAILLHPSDVRMCSEVLASWKDWSIASPAELQVFFTRAPTLTEARQLVLHRIRGRVLALPNGLGAESIYTPTEFLVTAGNARYWKIEKSPQARLTAHVSVV